MHRLVSNSLIDEDGVLQPQLWYLGNDIFASFSGLTLIVWWSSQDLRWDSFFRHAVSQLQLSFVAFCACAVFIYVLHWTRPKDVRIPLPIFQIRSPFPTIIKEILTGSHPYSLAAMIWCPWRRCGGSCYFGLYVNKVEIHRLCVSGIGRLHIRTGK